jgi:membrane fusion protein
MYGEITFAVPVAWQSIGYLVFFGLAGSLAFLSIASYARVEVVEGVMTVDKGVAVIVPTRTGVIASVPVRDGSIVGVGTELATIRAEEDSNIGLPAPAQMEAAIAQQDASLSAQTQAAMSSAKAQLSQLSAQRAGLVAEIDQLRSQTGLQEDLIATAQKDYDRALAVAGRGFISQRDLDMRRESLLVRQQEMSRLTQALAIKGAALMEVERSAMQVTAQAKVQEASLAASRAQVAQQAVSAAALRSYALRAPVAGNVTALTARVGQPANSQTALMAIIPSGSTLRAELTVPSAAIGFIKPGQEVRLAIDAFPYQRFGTVTGKVLTVARSAVVARDPSGSAVPNYPVTVLLDQATVSAFGRNEPLIPGMTLTARIVTEKQSLLQYLFEPLFAVRRR